MLNDEWQMPRAVNAESVNFSGVKWQKRTRD